MLFVIPRKRGVGITLYGDYNDLQSLYQTVHALCGSNFYDLDNQKERTFELFPMLSDCKSRNFIVPKPCGKREEVIHEGIQVISNPMHQAVEKLHSADGVLNHNARGGLFSVLFLLFWRERWFWVFLCSSGLFMG